MGTRERGNNRITQLATKLSIGGGEMGIHIGRCIFSLAASVCVGGGSDLALAEGNAEPLESLARVAPMQSSKLASAALAVGSDGAVLQSPNSADAAFTVRLVRAVAKTSQNSTVLPSEKVEPQGNSSNSLTRVAPMQSSNLASATLMGGSVGAVLQCQSAEEDAHEVRFVRAVPKTSQNSAVLSSRRLN